MGRRTKVVLRAVRRLLHARDEGRCRFPGCVNRRVHAPHPPLDEGWADRRQQPADLCTFHHRRVHEGRWLTVTLMARSPSPVPRAGPGGDRRARRFRGTPAQRTHRHHDTRRDHRQPGQGTPPPRPHLHRLLPPTRCRCDLKDMPGRNRDASGTRPPRPCASRSGRRSAASSCSATRARPSVATTPPRRPWPTSAPPWPSDCSRSSPVSARPTRSTSGRVRMTVTPTFAMSGTGS